MNDNELAAAIRRKYSLTKTAQGWRALSLYQGTEWAEVTGPDKAGVIAEARAQWGHFNYRAEALAFEQIFPGHFSQSIKVRGVHKSLKW